jgi:hypothetical protein
MLHFMLFRTIYAACVKINQHGHSAWWIAGWGAKMHAYESSQGKFLKGNIYMAQFVVSTTNLK